MKQGNHHHGLQQESSIWSSIVKHDFASSIVVFLVALPLCMGIAIASGMPPVSGLITGIIGGLVVGWISGCPLQVSGPAAGLAVIVYNLVQGYQNDYRALHETATDADALRYSISMLGVVVLLAGVFQFIAGLARLGQWFRAVSPAVIQGMLAGIGVLIFAAQFHVMVHDKPRDGGLANLLALPEAVMKGIFPLTATSVHHFAALIGVATILTIIVWSFAPKKLKVLPAPLVAVILATVLTAAYRLPIDKVEIPANILADVQLPTFDSLRGAVTTEVLLAALAMALVASAETLLCATAVDKMQNGPRTKYDRELASQGVGNMLCGLLGGLPMTGVIVRSSANVHAGARTRASAILHGAWMLCFVAVLPWVLELIPICALAAVLVYTGYKLVNPKAIKTLWQYGKMEVVIYAATLGVIVAKDLLTGVLVGIALSVAKLVYTFSHLAMRMDDNLSRNRTTIHLSGAATFLSLPKLAAVLDQVRPNAELHIHLEELTYIDHACLDLLMTWEKQHEANGGKLYIDWEKLHARFRTEPGANKSKPSSNGATHKAPREPAMALSDERE
jgi:MFS superfamily sulfate permease-like transporter